MSSPDEDEKVAVLVSLMEGAVSMVDCRSALAEARGDVQLAVELLFGAPRGHGSSAAGSLGPGFGMSPPLALRPGSVMIDLEPPASSDGQLVCRGSGRTNSGLQGFAAGRGTAKASSPPSTQGPVAPKAGAGRGRRGPREAEGDAAAAAAAAAAPPPTKKARTVSRDSWLDSSLEDTASRRAVLVKDGRSKKPKKNMGHLSSAWEEVKPGMRGDWQEISGDYLDVPGADWAPKMLEEDPPCLTLRSLHPSEEQENARNSKGDMRVGRVTDISVEDIVTTLPLKIRTSKLRSGFLDLLGKVRYPPDQVTLTWRLAEIRGSKTRTVPADLRGPLPSRPFKLLDNSGDIPAQQPPRFGSHQLRPEQLRSLCWMLQREGHEEAAPEDPYNIEPDNTGEGGGSGSSGNNGFVTEWRSFLTVDADKNVMPEETPCQIVAGARVKLVEAASASSSRATGCVEERMGLGMARVMWDDGTFTSHLTEALEFVDDGTIKVGSLVRIKPTIKQPSFGWGGVTATVAGIVIKVGMEKGGIVTVRFPMHPGWKGKIDEVMTVSATSKAHILEFRAQASYRSQGGILADKIGYGKTATTIALIDSTLHIPKPPMQELDRGQFFPAKGTLIIVPSNLLDQWLGEFSKFLWDGRPYRGCMKNGWAPAGSPLKIFAVSLVTPLSKATAADIADADVVICSYRLLFSEVYVRRRKELSCTEEDAGTIASSPCYKPTLSKLMKQTEKLMKGKISLPSGKTGPGTGTHREYTKEWKALQFPVLEQFHWKRIVFDEFHELESFESLQQNSLQHMRSSYRWGLTGTPPVESISGVIFMSSLFRIDLPGYLPVAYSAAKRPALEMWESDRLMSDMAVHFLDTYVRQNTAELPDIRLEEHIMVVNHTPDERALYLGQAHDAPDLSAEEAFESEDNVRSLERLLKLCSHFQATGDHAESAKQECARISDQKDRRVVKARNQMLRCSRVIVLLQRKMSMARLLSGFDPEEEISDAWRAELKAEEEKAAAEGDTGANSVAVLASMTKEAATEYRMAAYETLDGHKPRDEELVNYLKPPFNHPSGSQFCMDSWMALEKESTELTAVERLLANQGKEQAANLREHVEATASQEFFKKTLAALARDDSTEARSCSVCMEDDLPLCKLAITPCAHAFCIDCLTSTVTKFQSCSLCRRKLTKKDIVPLAAELTPTAPAAVKAKQPAAATPKYGTKLEALVKKLQELRKGDSTAKVILFVQFDDLKRKVALALEDSGVPTVQLHGNVAQRSNIIRDWQENSTSRAFVLLLSLAQSASGTNLTAASHVVFLHPMLAPTAERAVGHELQAIGRARRHGQTRDVVHVWRFITAGTVEQAITERHQSALWARVQARGEASNEGGAASVAISPSQGACAEAGAPPPPP